MDDFVVSERPTVPIDVWEKVRPKPGTFERQKLGAERGDKALAAYQLETVRAIESRFFGGGQVEQGDTFLLADGTGAGKTAVLLDAAVQVNNQTGMGSLIVVKDDLSIEQGLAKAQKMRINLHDRNISYCRYDELAEKLHAAKPGELGMVALDEAHVLTQEQNKEGLEAVKEFAGKKLFATATACGSVENILLFEELMNGTPQAETAKELGLKPEKVDGKLTGKYEVTDPDKFMERLHDQQTALASDGATSKKEFPLWGELHAKEVGADSTTQGFNFAKSQYTVAKQLRDGTADAPTVTAQIQALSEYARAEKVAKDIASSVLEGHAVVLYGNDKETHCEALKDEPFHGTIPSFVDTVREELARRASKDLKLAEMLGKIVELKDPEPYQNYNSHLVADVFSAKKSALAILPPSLNEGINGLCDTDLKHPRQVDVLVAGFDPNLPPGPALVQCYGRAFRNKTASPSEGRVYFTEGSITDEAMKERLTQSLDMLTMAGSGVAKATGQSIEDMSEKDQLTKKQEKKVEKARGLVMPDSEKEDDSEIVTVRFRAK